MLPVLDALAKNNLPHKSDASAGLLQIRELLNELSADSNDIREPWQQIKRPLDVYV
jgi:hypothetical protein